VCVNVEIILLFYVELFVSRKELIEKDVNLHKAPPPPALQWRGGGRGRGSERGTKKCFHVTADRTPKKELLALNACVMKLPFPRNGCGLF
jgi:hypothetical protein